jgi:hypothetical protein
MVRGTHPTIPVVSAFHIVGVSFCPIGAVLKIIDMLIILYKNH